MLNCTKWALSHSRSWNQGGLLLSKGEGPETRRKDGKEEAKGKGRGGEGRKGREWFPHLFSPTLTTDHLIWLLIYHWTTICTSGIFYTYVIDVRLRNAPCVLYTSRVSSINYYLVSSLPLHKICAWCDILTAISVLRRIIPMTLKSVFRMDHGPKYKCLTMFESFSLLWL